MKLKYTVLSVKILLKIIECRLIKVILSFLNIFF
jgi:hypothetical protein